jgi:hypothetical protein
MHKGAEILGAAPRTIVCISYLYLAAAPVKVPREAGNPFPTLKTKDMVIYLHDIENNEEIRVNLTVAYALPCHDLFAAFSTKVKGNGITFQEHQAQKVSHLLGGSFTHGGDLYTATLGFFLDGQRLVPIFIDGACVDGEYSGFGFSVAQQAYGHYPDRQALFHYPGAPSLLEDAKPLTFREAAAQALEGGAEANRAYALTSANGFTLEGLVGQREFSEYMERPVAFPE